MVRATIFNLVLLFCSASLQAQDAINPIAYGPGTLIATDQSSWSLFRNPAGLAETESVKLLMGYHYPFNLRELQSLYIGFVLPLPPNIGLSLFQSGSKIFLNQQLSLTASEKFGSVGMGIRVKYWRQSFNGYDPLTSFSLSVGLQVQLAKDFLVGVFLSNVTQNRIASEEILPTIWITGISYSISEELNLSVEVAHRLVQGWEFSLGANYRLKKRLFARGGFNTSNRQSYFGLGFQSGRLELDYAIGIHFPLGVTHQAGITYSW